LEKKVKREGYERNLKDEAEFKHRKLSTRLYYFSHSSFGSTIFGEIASIPNICAPNIIVDI
jgi:hypothetical protein